MFMFLIIILFCTIPPRATNHWGPRRPLWPHWVIKIASVHLVNMTEELLKDMAYKLKHAEKIRDSHGISLPFLLGSVAAGVQERFHRMLKLYRKYANMRDFKAQRWGGRELLNAYHIILISPLVSDALQTPNMAPLMQEMSTGLITLLTNETKDYRPSSVRDIMNSSSISMRRQLMANYDGNHHYYTKRNKRRACFSTSITYQSALWDLRRYFQIRWLYVDNVEFEVGYLTQEIIHRYQMVLELYQMTERRFIPHQNENFAWPSYMLYVYVNILEQCKVVIHMCNMLHELEAKYNKIKIKKPGVFVEYIDDDIRGGRKANLSDALAKDRLARLTFQKQQQREQKRLARERKKERSRMLKLGKTIPWKRPRPTKNKHHDIIYGWSIEDWW